MRNEFERDVVATSSRRKRWQMRSAAVLGSAALILLACWGAGVFDQWRGWFGPKQQIKAAAPSQPAPVIPKPPIPMPSAAGSRNADEGAVGKMRLIATQPGRNAREGTAQLATGSADPLMYVAGALLANGASLLEIYSDHVVLKRGDATTELYVEGTARSARGAKVAAVREDLVTVDKPEAKSATRPMGPETYANLLRSAPRFIDGKVSGFEIYPGTDGGALSRLSLQSGDVLLEIDGRTLTSIEQLRGSLAAIRSGASLTATVQRGAEQVVLTMDGAMLKQQPLPSLAELPRP